MVRTFYIGYIIFYKHNTCLKNNITDIKGFRYIQQMNTFNETVSDYQERGTAILSYFTPLNILNGTF